MRAQQKSKSCRLRDPEDGHCLSKGKKLAGRRTFISRAQCAPGGKFVPIFYIWGGLSP